MHSRRLMWLVAQPPPSMPSPSHNRAMHGLRRLCTQPKPHSSRTSTCLHDRSGSFLPSGMLAEAPGASPVLLLPRTQAGATPKHRLGLHQRERSARRCRASAALKRVQPRLPVDSQMNSSYTRNCFRCPCRLHTHTDAPGHERSTWTRRCGSGISWADKADQLDQFSYCGPAARRVAVAPCDPQRRRSAAAAPPLPHQPPPAVPCCSSQAAARYATLACSRSELVGSHGSGLQRPQVGQEGPQAHGARRRRRGQGRTGQAHTQEEEPAAAHVQVGAWACARLRLNLCMRICWCGK